MAEKTKVTAYLPQDILEEIEEYRSRQRPVMNVSAAIEALIFSGLATGVQMKIRDTRKERANDQR